MREVAQYENDHFIKMAAELMEEHSDLFDVYQDRCSQELMNSVQILLENKLGQKDAILTASGSDALLCVLLAINIHPQDEVILPVSICQCVINTILQLRAVPVLVDVDEHLSFAKHKLIQDITPHTKAIIAYHPYGMACDFSWLQPVVASRKQRIYVIEDCAQSSGTVYNGIPVGSIGDFSIFSFGKGKPICAGIGGSVNTHIEEMKEKLLFVCRSGVSGYPDDRYLGIHTSLSNVDTLSIYYKLFKMDELLELKVKKAELYQNFLRGCGDILDDHRFLSGRNNVYHRLVLNLGNSCPDLFNLIRRHVICYLDQLGIHTIQTAVPVPPYKVNFLNRYYKEIGRQDLIDEQGERYINWRTLENQYLYFRTNEVITEQDIQISCQVLQRVYQWNNS